MDGQMVVIMLLGALGCYCCARMMTPFAGIIPVVIVYFSYLRHLSTHTEISLLILLSLVVIVGACGYIKDKIVERAKRLEEIAQGEDPGLDNDV